jgi:hypothetical protein
MYSILNQAIEDIPAVRRGPDLRVDHIADFVSVAEPESHRFGDIPPAVNLTESSASWAGSAAFQARWTSLAA